MNKILVTGAAGFVGKELCHHLRGKDLPYVASVRRAVENSQFALGDLTGNTDWGKVLEGCGSVIHLAARVHVMADKVSDPLSSYREMNVEVTMNLARQAAALGIKRFVFVSSIKVNGEETAGAPFAAHDAPAPVDPYGQSKLEAELALQALSRQTGMEIVIVRPPLVYGPGVRANFFRLMQLVRLGLPLPLGGVHNRRSMVALDNLVDLLVLCTRHPAAAGQTFLVSDDKDLSIADLSRVIAQAMGKRAHLLPVPAAPIMLCARALGRTQVAQRLLGSLQVDISHTRQTLGWRPVIDTDAAVLKTVRHFLAQA